MSINEKAIKALGTEIQKLRREFGLSQVDFSELIGRTVQHLSKIERGDRAPSIELLFKISQELNVTPSELLSCLDQKPSKPVLKIQDDMISVLNKCTPKQAKLILKVSKEIYSSN